MNTTPLDKEVSGLTKSREFLGGLFTLFSATAMLASFMLSIEALYEARNPGSKFGCDINAVLSCSEVAKQWQAELLQLGKYSVPNAFLGMIFEAVFITIGVLLAFGGKKFKMPKWFMTASQVGNFGALVFAYWLFYQSGFVIKALCPWCILLMFSTTIQFFTQLFYSTLQKNLYGPKKALDWLSGFIRKGYAYMALTAWIIFLIFFIVFEVLLRMHLIGF